MPMRAWIGVIWLGVVVSFTIALMLFVTDVDVLGDVGLLPVPLLSEYVFATHGIPILWHDSFILK